MGSSLYARLRKIVSSFDAEWDAPRLQFLDPDRPRAIRPPSFVQPELICCLRHYNLETAKELGLIVPPSILSLADELVE
jgi:hypothetical protein